MRTIHRISAVFCLTACGLGGISLAQDAKSAADPAKSSGQAATPKVRSFQLEYGATLTKLPAGKPVRVWLPVPMTNDYQKVREATKSLPARAQEGAERKYGNRMLYFQTTAPESGEIPFHITWDIDRQEVRNLDRPPGPSALSAEDRKKFLAPDKRVPVNDDKALALIKGEKLPADALDLGRVLYNVVDDHVKYDKSQPGYGFGDVHWVCDSGFGNCTDFHSLFISLARSKGLPSFFAIGFPLPTDKKEGEIGGYHCWALFHAPGHGWVPVDISEADKEPKLKEYYFGNLTADRVTFTVGRDLELEPKQDGEPLNYFIYPYVEVDGKPHNDMKRLFRFKDR